MNKPIACDLYDYLEIACLFQYQLEIVLKSGQRIRGVAVDTCTLPDKTEALKVLVDGDNIFLPMHDLASVRVLSQGARFEFVDFTGAAGL